ncbi:hypothetical protein [Falsiroseomonas tokyonensis]|uniref:Uncharacterized protein n=1 Tax=Falsiroseomonas tokyonensis TaxID=430521 RepID=A0ABV7C0N9_9PROT|nr:hypothetical protein [Falsiroseomonas tokyonensis]MBU8540224.1 hypothetical protein [Falsiroseomonas tokyonensis]
MNNEATQPAEPSDGGCVLNDARAQAKLIAQQAHHMTWSKEEAPPVTLGLHGALFTFGLGEPDNVLVQVDPQNPLNVRGLDADMLRALAGTMLGIADALEPFQPPAAGKAVAK